MTTVGALLLVIIGLSLACVVSLSVTVAVCRKYKAEVKREKRKTDD